MKVLLLAGGDSAEREVSLTSGQAVYDALTHLGHEVMAIDPHSGNSLLNKQGEYCIPEVTKNAPLKKITTAMAHSLLQKEELVQADVVFIALHGGKGENGTLQCLLDLAGKKYTGSGRVASTIAMNKALTKKLAVSLNISTPTWELFRIQSESAIPEIADEISRSFDLPVIIKPNDGGSTIGLTLVNRTEQITQALKTAMTVSPEILLEQYIPGREMTVAVLNGKPFPVVEIKPVDGLYDYEAKYTKGKSQYFVPADIDAPVAESLREAAKCIYNLISADGLARVDFILDEQNGFHFLELNTLPGMTALSLAPMAAKAAGIEFDRLVQILLETAVER